MRRETRCVSVLVRSDIPRSNLDVIGREHVDDIDAILAVRSPEGPLHDIVVGGSTIFTWDYERTRHQLARLYEKAKASQWNASLDLDWSTPVDQEAISDHLAMSSPQVLVYKQMAAADPTCPLHGWTDEQFRRFAFDQQSWMLSNFVHGEQGALVCTAKITEQVPWIDAKYYAATQVMDEARHVEVFSRYLDEKLTGAYPINGHLLKLLDDIIADDRWDMTHLGMQVMVEGLALAAFSLMLHLTEEPLLRSLLRYVMSDEARHVAFGVLSLREAYEGMTAAEIRERQEFAFESGLLMRDRGFQQELWEHHDIEPRAMLTWELANVPNSYSSILFSKIVPNIKKLGLLDAGDGWLRAKYEEIGVIQYEDWIDTSEEYDALDLVAADRSAMPA